MRYSIALLLVAAAACLSCSAFAAPRVHPDFIPCEPSSEVLGEKARAKVGSDADLAADLDLEFCALWNPEFQNNGNHCCGKFVYGGRRSRRAKLNRCAPARRRGSFCHEMTEEQRQYSEAASNGKLGDLLAHITIEMGRKGRQAHCTVNNGFLSGGRRLIPTNQNRVILRNPDRCVDFGTDSMIGMLEWLGREVAREYKNPGEEGVGLMVGDISAPRGGCLTGRSGRRGHASHTTGQDADVGFLTIVPNRASPAAFHKNFDARSNWWLLKKIFSNPFACVKVVFLDRKHINKLYRVAANDEEWKRIGRFIRHMPHHRDHLHIRVGHGPGQPGCVADAKPELELEEDLDIDELAEE